MFTANPLQQKYRGILLQSFFDRHLADIRLAIPPCISFDCACQRKFLINTETLSLPCWAFSEGQVQEVSPGYLLETAAVRDRGGGPLLVFIVWPQTSCGQIFKLPSVKVWKAVTSLKNSGNGLVCTQYLNWLPNSIAKTQKAKAYSPFLCGDIRLISKKNTGFLPDRLKKFWNHVVSCNHFH